MHEHTGPFLSSTVIRRILALHPFSAANRAYLEQEAERRRQWEQVVEALVSEGQPQDEQTLPGPAHRREVAGADVRHSHS